MVVILSEPSTLQLEVNNYWLFPLLLTNGSWLLLRDLSHTALTWLQPCLVCIGTLSLLSWNAPWEIWEPLAWNSILVSPSVSRDGAQSGETCTSSAACMGCWGDWTRKCVLTSSIDNSLPYTLVNHHTWFPLRLSNASTAVWSVYSVTLQYIKR